MVSVLSDLSVIWSDVPMYCSVIITNMCVIGHWPVLGVGVVLTLWYTCCCRQASSRCWSGVDTVVHLLL